MVPIEDNFEDVLMKAATGLGFGKQELAQRSGLPLERVAALLKGQVDQGDLLKLAPSLNLHGPALLDLAMGTWAPPPIKLDGLRQYTTPFPVPGYAEMTVNSYLIWDPATRAAMVFDAGADASELLADVVAMDLDLRALVFTHTHRDHVAAADQLLDAIEGRVLFAPELELWADADTLEHRDELELENLQIQARLTNGHSKGGMSYVVDGLGQTVVIVGDALFCLSQGGAAGNYELALQNNREQILSLSEATVICPGHGPMTTVAEEQKRNPFYPEFK